MPSFSGTRRRQVAVLVLSSPGRTNPSSASLPDTRYQDVVIVAPSSSDGSLVVSPTTFISLEDGSRAGMWSPHASVSFSASGKRVSVESHEGSAVKRQALTPIPVNLSVAEGRYIRQVHAGKHSVSHDIVLRSPVNRRVMDGLDGVDEEMAEADAESDDDGGDVDSDHRDLLEFRTSNGGWNRWTPEEDALLVRERAKN